jgi:membrane protease subunit HflK
LLTEYRKAPEVTRQRLYLDAVQEVLSNSSKVMVDVEGGNNMLYLPLDRMVNQKGNVGVGGGSSANADIRELTNLVVEQLRRDNAARSSNTTRGGR